MQRTSVGCGPAGQGGIEPPELGFGIVVSSTQPVLIERPFYVIDRDLPPLSNGRDVVIGLAG